MKELLLVVLAFAFFHAALCQTAPPYTVGIYYFLQETETTTRTATLGNPTVSSKAFLSDGKVYLDGDLRSGSSRIPVYLKCSGTIIGATKILTTASCVEEIEATPDFDEMFVVTAEFDGLGLISYTVINWVQHDGYNMTTDFNNIAVLTVEKEIPSTALVHAISWNVKQADPHLDYGYSIWKWPTDNEIENVFVDRCDQSKPDIICVDISSGCQVGSNGGALVADGQLAGVFTAQPSACDSPLLVKQLQDISYHCSFISRIVGDSNEKCRSAPPYNVGIYFSLEDEEADTRDPVSSKAAILSDGKMYLDVQRASGSSRDIIWLQCSGTIIGDTSILTTASCVEEILETDGFKSMSVTTAEYDGFGYLSYSVVKWDIHAGFNETTDDNNIAILTVEKTIPDTALVKAVLWNEIKPVVGTKCGYSIWKWQFPMWPDNNKIENAIVVACNPTKDDRICASVISYGCQKFLQLPMLADPSQVSSSLEKLRRVFVQWKWAGLECGRLFFLMQQDLHSLQLVN